MKKIFTFLVAFLTTVSGAVWGQQSHDISSGDLNIDVSGEATYTVTGETDEHSISVSGGGTAKITLNGVKIDLNKKDRGAFKITNNTTVYLTLAGGSKTDGDDVNLLRSDRHYAGIYVEEGSTLIITKESGNNHLKAECVSYEGLDDAMDALAAGIGGGSGDTPTAISPDDAQSPNFGTIRIEGGDIESYCYVSGKSGKAYGAGLGGGHNSTKGDIIIIGGTVQASCMDVDAVIDSNQEALGAGIGGGEGGTCTSITILGGNVTASVDAEGDYGYTIGTGQNNNNQSPAIILGSWDENTTPTIIEKINDEVISGTPGYVRDYENYLDVRGGTPTIQQGTVTMPANTQMVLNEDPTSTLNAYKVVYNSNLPEGVTISGGSMPTAKMAYGPSTPYTLATVSNLTATVNSYPYQVVSSHWLNNSNAWVAAGKDETTSASVPSGLSTIPYGAAWVLKEASLEFNDDEGLSVPLNVYGPEAASFDIKATDDDTYTSLEDLGLQINGRQLKKADPYSAVTLGQDYKIQLNFTPKDQTTTALQGIINVNVKDTPDDASSLVISAATTEGNVLTYNGAILNKGTDGKYINDKAIAIKKADGTTVSTSLFKVEYSLNGTDGWSEDLKNAGKYYVRITSITGAFDKDPNTTTEAIVEVKKADAKVIADNVVWTIREGEGPDFSKALSATGVGEDKLTVTSFTNPTGTWTEPGIYNVTYTGITLSDTKNYNTVDKVIGKLTVKAKGTGEEPIDPNPDDGEESEDPIIKPGDDEGNTDGWTWDATANQWKRTYDGDPHPFTKITVTYTDETAEGENKTTTVPLTVGEGADATVTYSTDKDGTATVSEIKNADTYYAHITINKDGVISGEVEPVELVIEERPVTVDFDLPASIDASTETLPASDYADWQEEGEVPNEGLVKDEKPICEGTLFLVESEDYPGYFNVYLDKKTFKVEDNPSSSFLVSNYIISVETKDGKIELVENGEGGETLPDDPNNPDDPIIDGPDENDQTGGIEIDDSGSTGGSGISTKRYRLYLANQDYLNTGEYKKYYDELGLVLYSRHNQKYTTNTDKSFTIWYEQNGEVNAGNFRVFMSNRANGEYKEVTLDEVSGYYQIRNVTSNVYVKLCWSNGHPVANEDITATDARAYAQANKIVVITPEPTDVQIISMAGAVVATDKVIGQREFANLTEGVYIVRMGETVVKLQVRK